MEELMNYIIEAMFFQVIRNQLNLSDAPSLKMICIITSDGLSFIHLKRTSWKIIQGCANQKQPEPVSSLMTFDAICQRQ